MFLSAFSNINKNMQNSRLRAHRIVFKIEYFALLKNVVFLHCLKKITIKYDKNTQKDSLLGDFLWVFLIKPSHPLPSHIKSLFSNF